MTPGIYWNLPAAIYHDAPGLSNSGMKSLDISPYRYWQDSVRPDREPRTETPAMKLGTALHTAVLEEATFNDRYGTFASKEDFPGCLDTVGELKVWLAEHHQKVPSGFNKPDIIAMVQRVDPTVKILEVEMRRHGGANHGKVLLDKGDMDRVRAMTQALKSEKRLARILARGKSEVSVFVKDPETGILLKCRMDWVHQQAHANDAPNTILDLKTFSAQDMRIDEAVVKALRYRGYIRQAWFYLYVAKIAGLGDFMWVNAFVESEKPHEVRLRSMGPTLTSTARYWENTGLEVLKLIRTCADYQQEFGAERWAYEQHVVPVRDSELPGLAFGRKGEDIDV